MGRFGQRQASYSYTRHTQDRWLPKQQGSSCLGQVWVDTQTYKSSWCSLFSLSHLCGFDKECCRGLKCSCSDVATKLQSHKDSK